MTENNLIGSESDVGALNEDVALKSVVDGEVGYVAAVNGGLVSAQVETVAETEEEVGGGRHYCRFVVNRRLRVRSTDRQKLSLGSTSTFAVRHSDEETGSCNTHLSV